MTKQTQAQDSSLGAQHTFPSLGLGSQRDGRIIGFPRFFFCAYKRRNRSNQLHTHSGERHRSVSRLGGNGWKLLYRRPAARIHGIRAQVFPFLFRLSSSIFVLALLQQSDCKSIRSFCALGLLLRIMGFPDFSFVLLAGRRRCKAKLDIQSGHAARDFDVSSKQTRPTAACVTRTIRCCFMSSRSGFTFFDRLSCN